MPLSLFKKIKGLRTSTSKIKYQEVTELSFVVRFILTLSHGQASVERGFNLINAFLKTNMSPNTIIAKRIIKDHLLSNDVAPHIEMVSPAMIKSFRLARQNIIFILKRKKRIK